jgi:hypothetical protein
VSTPADAAPVTAPASTISPSTQSA